MHVAYTKIQKMFAIIFHANSEKRDSKAKFSSHDGNVNFLNAHLGIFLQKLHAVLQTAN